MMISEERLKWLQANKGRGDILAVVAELNPDNDPEGINYPVAASIINGKLWGKHGEAFCNALEVRINNRIEKLEEERRLYAK